MTYLAKPQLRHPSLKVNDLGLTRRDYEGAVSTLCAGCGHDSISAAIVHACFNLDLPPHRIAKLSGIGCSSKTPTYFLGTAHGFNSVHGRMPSVLTGAACANRELIYLGVSGDGDSASIGLGQFAHCLRRGVNMVYIVENNGVYGLTKGQFSATADRGSKDKKGVSNATESIALVGLALELGATFVGRSFSGDKEQLIPLIEAALMHEGAAFLDVISPCVTFNNHEGSTKSFEHVREHEEVLNVLDTLDAFDLLTPQSEITAQYEAGTVQDVLQHDGTTLRLRKLAQEYDVYDRNAAMAYLHERGRAGEIVTGLIYVDPQPVDMHANLGTIPTPLNLLGDEICPGAAALDKINASYR
jgi:2-oxoglutarate ferredoxin oxidoreductase subunit beta